MKKIWRIFLLLHRNILTSLWNKWVRHQAKHFLNLKLQGWVKEGFIIWLFLPWNLGVLLGMSGAKKKKEAPSGAFVGPNQRDHMHELAQRSVNWLALMFFHKMRGVCYGGILGFPCWTTDTFTLWYSSQRARRSFWACPIVVLCGLQDASLPLLYQQAVGVLQTRNEGMACGTEKVSSRQKHQVF